MDSAALTKSKIDGFELQTLTFLDKTKSVYVAGHGPAVIVMSEMPGIYDKVIEFAERVRDAGFTVWMPHMFGVVHKESSPGYLYRSMARACISREFYAFSYNQTSPIVNWLKALAAHAHPICGGAGVGAVGMCFTGNFALSLMLEKSVIAPVLCQPSLPISQKGGLHISPDELRCVKDRLEDEDLTVLAYRFEGDSFCQSERFNDYTDALGDRFKSTVIPDAAAAMSDSPPHSVVTKHLIDEAGEPTRAALDEILSFYRHRLSDAT